MTAIYVLQVLYCFKSLMHFHCEQYMLRALCIVLYSIMIYVPWNHYPFMFHGMAALYRISIRKIISVGIE